MEVSFVRPTQYLPFSHDSQSAEHLRLEIVGSLVRDEPGALWCVFKLDTISSATNVLSPRMLTFNHKINIFSTISEI